MRSKDRAIVAIVDYGMGNLFSVKHACENIGLTGILTSSREEINSADAVILPGVGAFGDAMNTLKELGLADVLCGIAGSGKPFLAICLGMQLLMSKSTEFGSNEGLNIIRGDVKRFKNPIDTRGRRLKVPQVGWNRICKPTHRRGNDAWSATLLNGLDEGEYMYFVHSFYTEPEDKDVVLSESLYGDIKFCSSLSYKNIFACQFHPERSALDGLKIYKNFSLKIGRYRSADRFKRETGSKIRTT